MPSRIEPWGLAINEAMSSGNAIITSNVTGASFDLIRNNKNGLIFENNNSDDLAKKILFIYNNKKKVSYYKKESVKIISKWGFRECHKGLIKAIKIVYKKNFI